ncbi:MAG: ribosomal protein S18-alanine N-acetyltransferase [Deltaproteobacteria bacterium]|nr:ribosomal protein S18-alanine N-acetyltransferase [Deltaproteobacteria bacterium]
MIIRQWDSIETFQGELMDLDRECFLDGAWPISQWERFFIHAKPLLLTGFEGGRLIAFLLFTQTLDEAEILKIAVKSQLRNRGFGGRLLDRLLEQLRIEGIKRLFLEVRQDNLSAVGFYLRHRFLQYARRKKYYRDPVCDALLFRLDFPFLTQG